MPDKRTERIALRATAADKELIHRAAESCGLNVSEYAISRLVTHARRDLADRTVFRLDEAQRAEWEQINSEPAREVARAARADVAPVAMGRCRVTCRPPRPYG